MATLKSGSTVGGSTIVVESRTLTAGDGLSGGGNLSSNKTFAVDSTVVRTSGNQTISGVKTFTGACGIGNTGVADGGVSMTIRAHRNIEIRRVGDTVASASIMFDSTSENAITFGMKGAEVLFLSNLIFRSVKIYNATSSSSSNVYVGTDGRLFRSTSSIGYKKDIEDADKNIYRRVLDLRPVFYRAKNTSDAVLNYSYWGFIAEEVAEIDPRLVHWEINKDVFDKETGEISQDYLNIPPAEFTEKYCKPNGMQYDRVAVLLQAVVKDHDNEINELKKQIEDLQKVVTDLVSSIS